MTEPVGEPGRGAAPFRPDIQGLRAIAVLVVVAFHARAGLSGGFVGVDVFFVISGYVITGMMQAERARTGRISLGAFYQRRIRRLLPALALVLVVVLALQPWLGPPSAAGATTATATAGAMFAANVQLMLTGQGYFDARTEANALLHLWTLSVEEQFYLGFPLLLVACGWLARARRWAFGRVAVVVVVAAAAASLLLARALVAGWVPGVAGSGPRLAFYSAPTRAWEFLTGALLALVGARVSRRSALGLGAAGLTLLVACVVLFDEGTSFPLVVAGLPVVAAASLLVAGATPNRLTTVLGSTPLRWLGDRSYAWYLWHWPVIVFARSMYPGSTVAPVVGAVGSLVPAALSYAWVENPIRLRRDRRTVATVGLGFACLALPLALARTVEPVAHRLDRDPGIQAYRSALRGHADQTRGCVSTGVVVVDAGPRCRWAVPNARGRAVLIGDSNAGQFIEVFVAVAGDLRLGATVETRPSCPFVDVVLVRSGVTDRGCRAFYEHHLAELVADPPDVVVLAGAADLVLAKPEVAVGPPGPGVRVGPRRTARGKVAVLRAGLDRTLHTLERAGIGVVLVHPVPRFTGWQAPGECARIRVRRDPSGCGIERSTVEALRTGRAVTAVEDQAAHFSASIVTVDLGPVLCPGPTCSTFRDGRWIWKDESHLSIDGAMSVRPQLTAAVRAALGAVPGSG